METKTGNQNGKPRRHSNLRIVLHVLLCNSDPRVASRKRAGCPYFFSLVVRPPGGRRCEEQSYCAGDFYLSFAKQAGAVPAEKPLSFLHGTRTPTRVCRQAIRLTGGQLAVLVVGIRKPLAKPRRIIPRNKSRRKVLPYFNVCLTAPVMRCHFLHPRLYYNRAQWRSLSNKDLRRVCASRSNKTRLFAVCESLLEIPMLYPTELRAQRGFKDF